MRSQAMADEIIPALTRLRFVLEEIRLETLQTAADHEHLAAWYAKHRDLAAAHMERTTAAARRQRLADLDAAFEALEQALSAALELQLGLGSHAHQISGDV